MSTEERIAGHGSRIQHLEKVEEYAPNYGKTAQLWVQPRTASVVLVIPSGDINHPAK